MENALNFLTKSEAVKDIVDRALGGFEPAIDDPDTYPDFILDYYTSDFAPEPFDGDAYSQFISENRSEIQNAISAAVETYSMQNFKR